MHVPGTAAAAAASEQEFFAHLRRHGILVRTRQSARHPGQITGYAVALPADTANDGTPVWYSGGKLAADLTLPKLRHRWHDTPQEPFAGPAPRGGQLTWAERDTIWRHAAHTAADATEQIRRLIATDPAAAADAAWAASDTLHAAAAALGSRLVRQAADAYARAARPPYARLPRATQSGASLRRAARMISALGTATHDRSLTALHLVLRLAALAETVADLRWAQQRAAQAAAAGLAAQRLRALTHPQTPTSPRGPGHTRPRTAVDLTRTSFPGPAQPPMGGPRVPEPHTSPTPCAQPRRPRGPQTRPRGPGPIAASAAIPQPPSTENGEMTMNDPGGRHSDPFEDALSDGAQRAAQLASLAATVAQLLVQRRAIREARKAVAGDRQAAERLDQQERDLHRQDRLAWAPAHDRRWLAGADVFATAQVWGAAVLYADADPEAAAAVRKCEDRLRELHPYAMARYDRLRADGVDPADAMREAAPLFVREPHVRTGEAAPGRPALETLNASMADQDVLTSPRPGPSAADPAIPGEKRGEQIAARIQAQAREAGRDELGAAELATVLETITNLPHDAIERITGRVTHPAKRNAGQMAAPNAAQLAAVSFPHAITDAVAASSTGSPTRHALSTDRTQTRRRGLSR